MPSLHLTLPAGTVDPSALEAVAARLTGPLLRIEGLPEVDPFVSGSLTFVHELARVFAGGRPLGEPRVRVDVATLEGIVDAGGKAAMVREITDAFVDEAGLAPEQVVVFVDVLPRGGFGFAGQVLDVADLHALAATVTAAAGPTA